jgi:hypothetical protein
MLCDRCWFDECTSSHNDFSLLLLFLSVRTVVDSALCTRSISFARKWIDRPSPLTVGRRTRTHTSSPHRLSLAPKQGAVDRHRFGLLGRRALWCGACGALQFALPGRLIGRRNAQHKFVLRWSKTPLGIGGPTHSCMSISELVRRSSSQGTKKSMQQTIHCRNPGKKKHLPHTKPNAVHETTATIQFSPSSIVLVENEKQPTAVPARTRNYR